MTAPSRPVWELGRSGDVELQIRPGGVPARPPGARRIASWPSPLPDEPPTECWAAGGEVWILRRDIGGIRFTDACDQVDAFLAEEGDRDLLRRILCQDWLPVVYQYWGRQVLHASAALHVATGRVVACSGPSGSGKSTLGFGLGRRSGWRQLADDTLAFESTGEETRLIPIPNEVRLRPGSADHYGERAYSFERLDWPAEVPTLAAVYCLEPRDEQQAAVRLGPLGRAEAYTRLLEQAYALTLDAGSRNRRLMKDYLAVTRSVPAFRLLYRRSFAALEETLDALEAHALARIGSERASQSQ